MTEEKRVDRLYVERADVNSFNRLKENDSPFAGCQNKEIFLAAMVFGFYQGVKVDLKSKEGYVREEYLHPEDKALINAIAILEEGDLKVLLDKQKVYSIAEKYATGGIEGLKARALGIEEYGSYSKKLESDMLREYEILRQTMPEKPVTAEDLDGIPVIGLIEKGETDAIEFKSSLVWDYEKAQPSREMKIAVARGISSFMNSDGGYLLVGVDNKKNVIGLENDLAQTHESLDELEIILTNSVRDCLGKVNLPYIKTKFDRIDNKDIMIVRVYPSPHPVYLKGGARNAEFYIRTGNSTQKLDVSEAPDYIKEHWAD